MSYKIISKFIKDISFEIPNTQTFIMIEKEILNYNLNCDIKSKPYKENIIEVNTILKLSPNQNVKHKMLTEINLATLVSIEKKVEAHSRFSQPASQPASQPTGGRWLAG